MIHELREYRLTQANWPAYERLFLGVAVPVRGNEYGRLLGVWRVQDDRLDQEGMVGFMHLWAYESLGDRASRRAKLGTIAAWIHEFLVPAKVLIDSQTLSVLNPQGQSGDWDLSCSEMRHLHRFRCAVGEGPSVLAKLKPHGHRCWTTEFADPNEVASMTNASDAGAVQAKATALPQIRSARSTTLRPIELAVP